MEMKLDAIITWASGDKFCRLPEFNIFLKSIKKIGMSCDVIIFTHDMPTDIRQKLFADGFEVIDADAKNIHLVVRDRFLEIYRWLVKDGRKYHRVLLTDSKDVLFQTDPFYYGRSWDQEYGDEYVILCLEGGLHYQSEWNAVNQIKYQSNRFPFERKFTQSPIINSGFIIGTREEMKNLSLMIWSNSIGTAWPLSEQATLNYLYHFLIEDPIYKLADPCVSHLCATGEGIKQGWLEKPPVFKNNRLYHPHDDKLYCAFHQWERTCYKDAIFEAYAE